MKTDVKETLKLLHCPENTPVDPRLLSSILSFRNLVALYVGNDYCDTDDICTFDLTDNDVGNLAVTLPSLMSLRLGEVCALNSCRTTIASLLSISTHCLGLTLLEIHFNTQSIAGDMRRLLDEGSGRDKPRCELESLLVGCLPLRVGVGDVGIVAMGFADIFPCLKDFSSYDDYREDWKDVAFKLRD